MKQVGSTSMFHGLYTRRKAETLDLRTQEAGPFQSLSRSHAVLGFTLGVKNHRKEENG